MHKKWTSGIALLGLAACSTQQPPAPSPASASVSASVPAQQACIIGEGTASWYRAGGRGRAAAAVGELVAAHRSLPIGTLVQVTALGTGQTVTVRISGRGPFRHSRIIDVSEPAAAQLGILHDGVSRVQLKTDGAPDQACPVQEARISAN